jgi:hypothetical protein
VRYEKSYINFLGFIFIMDGWRKCLRKRRQQIKNRNRIATPIQNGNILTLILFIVGFWKIESREFSFFITLWKDSK